MTTGALPASPYKGLIPYSEEDAPFFFGREPEREIITANLMASRLTLLYGASGVGKSSVLRAGVAHYLRELARKNLAKHGEHELAVVVFSSWRDDPLVGLENQIRACIASALDEQTPEPSTQPNDFTALLQSSAERIGGQLFIILDQFEEYFLYHAQEDGEGEFAMEFPRAVNDPGLRVSFLISIREDALAKLDRFEGRIPNLFDNYLRVEHLDRDAALSAIVKPIEEYNRRTGGDEKDVGIEPELVHAVLDQVRTGQVVLGEAGLGIVGQKDASAEIETPFLQLVMTRLWNEEMRSGSRVLRLDTLKRLGGAESIVRTHLDESLSGLSQQEQSIAAGVFRYLVTPGGTKIAYSATDLAYVAEGDLKQDQIVKVLDALSSGDSRVLRPVAPPPDRPGETRFEIFHDVLGAAILDWRARYVQQQQLREAEGKLADERKRVRRQRLVLGVMAALLIATIVLAVFALRQRAEAENQRRTAQSRELAANALSQLEIDPNLGVLLAIAAMSAKRTAQAEEALRKTLQSEKISVMRGHEGWVHSASFSPDGRYVVTASEDKTARVWEAQTGKSLAELRGHEGPVLRASFNPDGRYVVTASTDKTARVWEAQTGKSLAELRGHEGWVLRASFSPDGRYVVTASVDKTARVWEAQTGKSLAELRGHQAQLSIASFSPDGRYVVTASYDKTARVWEAQTGKSLTELLGHEGRVYSASFSPDGRYVVTASSDKRARVWEAQTGKSLTELRGHEGPVYSASFSPDGRYVVTASDDKIALVYACDVCATFDELLVRARERAGRELTPDERKQYLPEP